MTALPPALVPLRDRLRHKLMTHERLGWSEIAPLVDDLQPVTLGVL